MAKRRHHRKSHRKSARRHSRGGQRAKFARAAKHAKHVCSAEFISKAKSGSVSSIQPYFKCVGRVMKKEL